MSKFIKKILEIGFFVGTLSVQALADANRYDFILEQKLSGSYGHITTTLANDTCAVYQECGYIHPFEIHVLYDF